MVQNSGEPPGMYETLYIMDIYYINFCRVSSINSMLDGSILEMRVTWSINPYQDQRQGFDEHHRKASNLSGLLMLDISGKNTDHYPPWN